MKQINGTPINIEEDILGRITLKKRNVFGRKDYILVAEDLPNVPSGYSASPLPLVPVHSAPPLNNS